MLKKWKIRSNSLAAHNQPTLGREIQNFERTNQPTNPNEDLSETLGFSLVPVSWLVERCVVHLETIRSYREDHNPPMSLSYMTMPTMTRRRIQRKQIIQSI